MFVALRIVSTLISIYMIVIIVRIVLTWFSGASFHGKVFDILFRMTDPYLNLFRGLRWLRSGNIDFSPVVAVLALSILGNVINSIAVIGVITLGVILAIIVTAIAAAAGFFLILFLILAVVRIIGFLANANNANRFWLTLDQLIEPIVYRFTQFILRGRTTTYQNGLLIFGGLILAVLVAGNFLMAHLETLLARLPV